jgi:hypothetical protein
MTMTQLSARQMRMKVDETYRRNMKNKEPETVDSASFSEFTLPDNVDELSPFLYFKIFWDDTITQNIVELKNYSTCSRYTTQNEFVMPI